MPTRLTPLALIAAALTLAGCAERPEPAPVVYRGTDPGVAAPARRPAQPVAPAAPVAGTPDANGVIDYGGYSAAVARPGDTVASMAARVGLSASALASYNGLPSGYAPRPGDELILPPRPTGQGAAAGQAPVETAVLSPLGDPIAATTPAPAPAAAAPAPAFDISAIEAAIDGPSTPAAPDASVAPAPPAPRAADRTLFTPSTESATTAAAAATATAAASGAAAAGPAPVSVAPTPAPVVAVTRPDVVASVAPPAAATAPALAQPAPVAARFVTPVNGQIVRSFNRSAGARSDGVDFAAPKGAAVVAAAPGQVALVSESLGGLGTIVLIRHENDLLTVYGRVDGVTVKKGDRVQQGQTIGAVAPGAAGRDPSLHFEVRQGAESVDPERYLPG